MAFEFVGVTSVTATTTTPTGPLPTGVAERDLLVALLSHSSSGASITAAPAGWTRVDDPLAADLSAVVYWKIAAAGEPDPTWTWSAQSNTSLDIVAYRGVDTVDASMSEAINANTITLGPLTPTVDDVLLIGLVAIDVSSNRTWTADPAMTVRVNTGDATYDKYRCIADEVLVGGAGVAQSRDFTVSGSAQDIAGFFLVVAPAATVAPPSGSAVGSWQIAGTAQGSAPTIPAAHGSAQGSWSFAGSASGVAPQLPPNSGQAQGTFTWAATATGSVRRSGTASGGWVHSGAASGSTARHGAASGAHGWTGTAAGSAPTIAGVSGSAVGSFAWAGTASGTVAKVGTALAGHTWTGTAAGTAPLGPVRDLRIVGLTPPGSPYATTGPVTKTWTPTAPNLGRLFTAANTHWVTLGPDIERAKAVSEPVLTGPTAGAPASKTTTSEPKL